MTDAFEIATPTQRRVVLLALVVYAALFVTELLTDSALAAGGADILLAALVIPASVLVVRREMSASGTDSLAIGAAVAFFVAGVTIGFEGLGTLGYVERIPAVEMLGTVALLVALALYLYRS